MQGERPDAENGKPATGKEPGAVLRTSFLEGGGRNTGFKRPLYRTSNLRVFCSGLRNRREREERRVCIRRARAPPGEISGIRKSRGREAGGGAAGGTGNREGATPPQGGAPAGKGQGNAGGRRAERDRGAWEADQGAGGPGLRGGGGGRAWEGKAAVGRWADGLPDARRRCCQLGGARASGALVGWPGRRLLGTQRGRRKYKGGAQRARCAASGFQGKRDFISKPLSQRPRHSAVRALS